MEDGTGLVIFYLYPEDKLPDNFSFLWRMYLAQSTVQDTVSRLPNTHQQTDNLGGTVGKSDKMYLTTKSITFTQEDK